MNYIVGMRHQGGYIVCADGQEANTYECCHCNRHYVRKVGDGPQSWCTMCGAPRCDQAECDPCIPFEAKLEAWEGTRTFWHQMEIV